MERAFGVEVLGEIPECRSYFRKKRNLLLESEEDEKNTEVVDNYIYLAHILKNRLSDWKNPIVYVTSSSQNEGKTTVIAHLAVHLAELGVKTLIIDFDTRNPKLGGLFLQKVEYQNSINALYHGDVEKEGAITSLTGHLDILPAVLERRPLPYDDSLLDLVRDLKQDYDVVLMDTAPVGQVADTMSLNRLADVALLVVRFDTSSMDSIRESLLRLDKSGMNIMGCVVNGVKELNGNSNNGSKSYGAHGLTRMPYRRREKTQEEREWERWQRERSEEKKADSDAEEEERPSAHRRAPKAQKEQGTEAYGDLENLLNILGAAQTSTSDSHPKDAE
jgi:capsular exopolysaccharide synthesis family protein